MTMATYDLANMIGAARLKRGLWWGKALSLVEGSGRLLARVSRNDQ